MDTHYAKLDCYKAELEKVDKEGKLEMLIELTNGGRIFKRFYIGSSCLRKGYTDGCRLCIA